MAQQEGVHLRDEDEARRVGAEQPAVMFRRHAIELDEDEGRAGDVGEHSGDGEAAGHAIGEEMPVAEQPPVLPEGTIQGRTRHVVGQGFRQPGGKAQQHQHAEQGQPPEDRLPAEQLQQQATAQRCQDRRQPHHQHQLRERLGRRDRVAEVAHHRPRHHHPGATAQRLDEACTDQPFKAGRQGTGHRRQGEDGHAQQQRRAAAETVRQRAIDQLTERQADEVGRKGQLHMLHIGDERLRQGGEAGQVEVDGHRAESAEGAKEQENAEGHGDIGRHPLRIRRQILTGDFTVLWIQVGAGGAPRACETQRSGLARLCWASFLGPTYGAFANEFAPTINYLQAPSPRGPPRPWESWAPSRSPASPKPFPPA
ncbi:hypothetical protein D9M71_331140 [compost metagenome]